MQMDTDFLTKYRASTVFCHSMVHLHKTASTFQYLLSTRYISKNNLVNESVQMCYVIICLNFITLI